eukprot:4147411-Pyramimonas_sp.AAC.1
MITSCCCAPLLEEKGTPVGVVYRARGPARWAAGRTGLPRPSPTRVPPPPRCWWRWKKSRHPPSAVAPTMSSCSMVLSATKRCTWTSFSWPGRSTRPMACASHAAACCALGAKKGCTCGGAHGHTDMHPKSLGDMQAHRCLVMPVVGRFVALEVGELTRVPFWARRLMRLTT